MNNKKHQEIQNRIDKFKTVKKQASTQANTPISSVSRALNIGVELVAGTIVGVVIGLFFDNLFDSKPLFLIICLIFAIIAAFKSIWNRYIKNNVT